MNIGIIPARLDSTRLPRKILLDLDGKPMIVHTIERALQSKKLDRVIVAIDSEETKVALKEFDYEIVMTSQNHISGTDRVAEVVKNIPEANVIVNIQGDEPLIESNIIDNLVTLFNNDDVNMSTIVSSKLTVSDLLNPNVVKAIVDEYQNVIEFKRNIFDLEIGGVYRHIGIYGFRRETLFHFTNLTPSVREIDANLEQLRALDNGIHIRAAVTNYESFSVDTKADLDKVSQKMQNSNAILNKDIKSEKD